jgi:hypothetical protein
MVLRIANMTRMSGELWREEAAIERRSDVGGMKT